MELKKPLTFDAQVSKLKEHGVKTNNDEFVKQILQTTNYYRISGYALPFRKEPGKSDYIEGTTFELIYQIYRFDEELRNLCRKYLEKTEVYYRT